MINISRLLLALALFTYLAFITYAQSAIHLTIRGTLIDEGGTPYAFNPVELLADGQTLKGKTNYQGYFEISGRVVVSSGILILKSTYNNEVLAEIPVVWASGGEDTRINLGEATVSLKERRFVGATEFALADTLSPSASAEAQHQQADLMSEPDDTPPAAFGTSPETGSVGSEIASPHDSANDQSTSFTETTLAGTSTDTDTGQDKAADEDAVTNPADTPVQPRPLVPSDEDTSQTPSQVNRIGASIAMAILVILGLGLIGGGAIASRRARSAKVRVKAKS